MGLLERFSDEESCEGRLLEEKVSGGLSARCAPIRPARRSEAARTSGSARSARTR